MTPIRNPLTLVGEDIAVEIETDAAPILDVARLLAPVPAP